MPCQVIELFISPKSNEILEGINYKVIKSLFCHSPSSRVLYWILGGKCLCRSIWRNFFAWGNSKEMQKLRKIDKPQSFHATLLRFRHSPYENTKDAQYVTHFHHRCQKPLLSCFAAKTKHFWTKRISGSLRQPFFDKSFLNYIHMDIYIFFLSPTQNNQCLRV